MTEQQIADGAAASSAALAGWTWIAQVNDVLQLIATAVAIVAGIYAVQWHRFRLKQGQRALDKKKREHDIQDTIEELEDKE